MEREHNKNKKGRLDDILRRHRESMIKYWEIRNKLFILDSDSDDDICYICDNSMFGSNSNICGECLYLSFDR